ncbi:RHS repeat-associated core domain protein [Delftia sp. Cs1-4]|uniref:RHS repeat-associated core domain-containing protein n=1 Tax=Delftia sp. (strain Cs1-4) TaxID=742013 RepID=UPI00020E7861|nr:RHS repeat-associated core domain-containing protein [Delftia sp. Cs1-4]AEF87330.1 RHS repeat-associated core domain protein [Delftia sp. Cs1-4]
MYSNDKQGLWHAWLSVTLMALSQWPGALRSRTRGLWLQVALPLMLGCALLVAASAASAATETVTYIHTDVSGSPLAATDSNGAVVWKESYRAYGERWLQQSGTGQQTQWFHGKEQDAATGLQYFGARYYDPAVGRFLGVDPIDFQEGNLHSFNRFTYGNNNPVKYKDPDGGYAEAAFEALSLAIGIDSFRKNFGAGNYGAAAVDGLGVAADAVLAAIPMAPGVAGLGIKAYRGAGDAVAGVSGVWQSSKFDAAKMEHIFSADHVRSGIMELGQSKDVILGQARDALLAANNSGNLREGMNTVFTKMNGHDATVRAFFKDGEMQSMNLFKGTSERAGQYVIDLR